VFEAFADDLARLTGRCVYYTQQLIFHSNNHIQANVMTLGSRHDRVQVQYGTGRIQLEALTTAYLQFRQPQASGVSSDLPSFKLSHLTRSGDLWR